jgi:tetratricopeptide (TPR) repeat protein
MYQKTTNRGSWWLAGLLAMSTLSDQLGALGSAWAQTPDDLPAPSPASSAGSGDVAPSPPSGAAAAPAPPDASSAPTPSTLGDVDDARTRMDRGQRLFAEGKYADAVDEFRAAYVKHRFTAFLFNAAVAAERGGKRDDAISLYENFLGSEPNAPDRPAIQATIARLRSEAADEQPSGETQKADIKSLLLVESEPAGAPVSIWQRIDPKAGPLDPQSPASTPGYRRVMSGMRTPNNLSLSVGTYFVLVEGFRDYNPTGSLFEFEGGRVYVYRASLSQGDFVGRVEVRVPVSSAKIYVDDPKRERAPRAVGPANIELTPGKHVVEIDAVGFEPFKREIEIVQGQTSMLDAKLTRVSYGYVLLSGNALEVEVEIDGVESGVVRRKKGPMRVRLPAGEHELELDAEDRKAWNAMVRVPAGQEITIDAKLEEAPGKGGAIVTAVLAAGSLAGGIVLRHHVDNNLAADDELRDPLSALATGSLVGAGVFTALSVFLFAYDPTDDSTAKLGEPREFTEEAASGASKSEAEDSEPAGALVSMRLVPFVSAPLDAGARGAGLFAAPTGLSVQLSF